MTSTNKKHARPPSTRIDKLIAVLSDGKWHSTAELERRVGPDFGQSKYVLVKTGVHIQRRAHQTKRWQFQYRVDLNDPIGCTNQTTTTRTNSTTKSPTTN